MSLRWNGGGGGRGGGGGKVEGVGSTYYFPFVAQWFLLQH